MIPRAVRISFCDFSVFLMISGVAVVCSRHSANLGRDCFPRFLALIPLQELHKLRIPRWLDNVRFEPELGSASARLLVGAGGQSAHGIFMNTRITPHRSDDVEAVHIRKIQVAHDHIESRVSQ